MSCHVFVDFDGTIALEDTTDLLLERFAGPAWQAIEDEWKAGHIGSRECMIRQIDLIRATPEAVDELLDSVAIDPGFAQFVSYCAQRCYPISVVSDGLDRNVSRVLKRAGLSLPVFANRFEWLGGKKWRLTFPHSSNTCAILAGNCKCRISDGAERPMRLMIGDGRSDFCIAGRVDMVFTKGSLTRYCIEENIEHVAFGSFAEVTDLLAQWMHQRTDKQANTPAIPGDE